MFASMNQLLEAAGFITGVAGIWLTIRRHISCFPVGIANVAISAWLFYGQKLYADVLQQGVYFALLAYGWHHWNHSRSHATFTPATWLDANGRVLLVLCIAGSTLLLGSLLQHFTDAVLPWADSFATSTAFAAQFLIARRKTENWILWLIVNLCYILIYLQRELPLYTLLFTIYFMMAIAGLHSWTRLSPSKVNAE